jgi:ADP-ribosyl-[dinitrogen reductase] hydrolase
MSEDLVESGRAQGALVGLAVGDALGLPVEFEPRSSRAADPIRGMRASGAWKLEAGAWSDDTALALCLAESICEKGFDPQDAGERFASWMERGLWSATGEAIGIGGSTRRSLERVRSGLPAVLSGGRGENDNGNGSLMRILPASLWLARLPDPARLRALAAYSAITHGHPRSMLGCYLHCLVAGRLLSGESPAAAYADAMEEARSRIAGLPASLRAEAPAYGRVLDGSLGEASAASIRGSGYVVHCLEASLWCLLTTSDYRSCVLSAVNLGEDADTTGAVAGGLAGLAYGRSSIPAEWSSCLARLPEIEALAKRLASLVAAPRPLPRSYWVLPGKLLAGGYPGRKAGSDGAAAPEAALRALLGAGVDAFLDLSSPGEDERSADYAPFLASGVERRSCPLGDMSADGEAVRRAMRELDLLLASGRTVYLHCIGGLGRTGTVVGSYLVEKALASPSEALGLLTALRAGTDRPEADSPQTDEQRLLVASTRPGPSALPL